MLVMRRGHGGLHTGTRTIAVVVLPSLLLAACGQGDSAADAAAVPVAGAIATSSGTGWSWIGPASCSLDAALQPLRVTTPRGTEPRRVPLRTVSALAAGNAAGSLVATGLDDRCEPVVLRSANGGASWSEVVVAPARAVDVDPVTTLWVVPLTSSSALQRVEGDAEAVPLETGCPQDQRLVEVSTPTPVDVYALCEDPFGTHRTLVRSRDGGATFEPVADDLSGAGLDGTATARSLVFDERERGWLLLGGRTCAEGDLRATRDGGKSWAALPCVSDSVPLDRVLGVDVAGDGTGALVGLRGTAAVLAVTDDSGASWRQVEPPAGQ